MDLIVYDNISVAENISPRALNDFAVFLRGLPFSSTDIRFLTISDIGSGYEQVYDRVGRTKKQFDINIPISHKSEIIDYENFYLNNYANVFDFTNPIDGIIYRVRFANDGFTIQQQAVDTFIAQVTLIEVL
jgi:hypothetical protein